MSELKSFSPPFIELYATGQVTAEDIHDFIDAWHDSDANETRPLAQFLGMTEDEYTVWLASRKILPSIVAARRNNVPLEDVVLGHLDMLRTEARPADHGAIRILSDWLSHQPAR